MLTLVVLPQPRIGGTAHATPLGKNGMITFVYWTSGSSELRVVRPKGGSGKVVLVGGQIDSPAWSPDGKWIAFQMSRGDSQPDLYLVKPDGSGLKRITRNPGHDGCPAWSPDGRRLAFCSDRSGSFDVWVMDVETGRSRRFTRARSIEWNPDWSPDGRSIAFGSDRAGNFDVWVKQVRSGRLTRVTRNKHADDYPSWSPTGTRIAFASLRSGNWDVFTIPLGGGKAERITTNPAVDLFPSWSPDGGQLAFESDRGEGFFNIFRYVFDRAEERQVTRFRLGNASEPDWQRKSGRSLPAMSAPQFTSRGMRLFF